MIKSWENRFFYVPLTLYNVLLGLGNEASPECSNTAALHIEQRNNDCSYPPPSAHLSLLNSNFPLASRVTGAGCQSDQKLAIMIPFPIHLSHGIEVTRGWHLHVSGKIWNLMSDVVASLAFLVYEICITLDQEIEYIWAQVLSP
jgi:hypothetical protein